jgi:hypothetical protein
MKSRILAVSFLFLAAMAIPHRAKAPPIPDLPNPQIPGRILGATTSYWRAPYVEVSEDEIGGQKSETVTWFSEDGSVEKQMPSKAGTVQYADPEWMARTTGNGQDVIYGLAEFGPLIVGPSEGSKSHYRMIDWDTEKVLWDILPPDGIRVTDTGFTSKLVIFTGAERYQGGPWKGSAWRLRELKTPLIRAMVAVSGEDGHFVSRWRDQYPTLFDGYQKNGCFVHLQKKLVFFTPEEMTELSEEDIIAGKNGWETVKGDK